MRRILYLVSFSCLLLLQSCFEIIEQVFIKNDGSGNFQLVINLSKSKTKINSIMKMKTVNGHRVPDKTEINQEVAEIERTIKTTAGISNVKTTLDYDNYIATLTCDFTKVDDLNTGIKNIAVKKKSTKPMDKAYVYDMAGKAFSRFNTFLYKDDYQKMSNADKEIFATANYTSIFRFETEIATTTNKETKISPNKKAAMVKLNALDLISNKKTIDNKIKLK